jgi:predicted ABC-type transport system involved in lysophospholipase L1 biosynthesis ATPase subunit
LDGRELLKLSDEEMRQIRGRHVAMIFQEPMTSLNPVLKIGLQIMEPLTIHLNMNEVGARERAIELLVLVGITDPESRLGQYPHQLSGCMRQRIMIAMGADSRTPEGPLAASRHRGGLNYPLGRGVRGSRFGTHSRGPSFLLWRGRGEPGPHNRRHGQEVDIRLS